MARLTITLLISPMQLSACEHALDLYVDSEKDRLHGEMSGRDLAPREVHEQARARVLLTAATKIHDAVMHGSSAPAAPVAFPPHQTGSMGITLVLDSATECDALYCALMHWSECTHYQLEDEAGDVAAGTKRKSHHAVDESRLAAARSLCKVLEQKR